ncbi:hypothetical protein [Paraliomyxa miuraensis]|nr:hypothetical protein [Paraliomyxa miuraensis]MCX4248000.1 hypothetical protein [Paraliomyxa miuraensis]
MLECKANETDAREEFALRLDTTLAESDRMGLRVVVEFHRHLGVVGE